MMEAKERLRSLSRSWLEQAGRQKYSYNFTWLGRPVIQVPQDLIAMQEIIWRVKPDLIIETGVAHGGSLIFYASILELLGGDARVLGIDIDIRDANRTAIQKHPLSKRIDLIEGSSTSPETMQQVRDAAVGEGCVLVSLDSNHTHAHVLEELLLYSPLVTKGSYMVVFDTIIEDMPAGYFHDRPWDKGDNPRTAVREFLGTTDRFEVDHDLEEKLLITVAPGGYLRCIK